jgi:uncharacterized protein YjbJ (UPF0337 family)
MALIRWRKIGILLVGMMLMAGAAQAGESWIRQGKAGPVVAVNEDQIAGKWKQFKGELKAKWAEFTEDDLMLIEGRIDILEGKIQERYGDRREEVKRWVDEWFESHADRPSQS